MAHGADQPEQKLVFDALLAALDVMDRDHATSYADIVVAVPPAAARDNLEALRTTTGRPPIKGLWSRAGDQTTATSP